MSNTRYRSQYTNTTLTGSGSSQYTQWTIEVCDTEAVSQVINFRGTKPVFNFEGLTQDLKPGIFPASVKFGMYLYDSPTTYKGTTYGITSDLITDINASDEGRFRVKLYKGEELYFIGVILPDQCTWTDEDIPHAQLTAVDGMYRLGSEDYVSIVGQIEYVTLSLNEFNDNTPDSTPIVAGLDGTEWVLISHYSNIIEIPPGVPMCQTKSTYARYEQFASESPGTGWVDQGDNLWAKELVYDNEVIVDEATKYHLTRDIDNEKIRKVSEYLQRGMAIMPTWDEYSSGTMYDVVNVWYDTTMNSLTADPTTQIKLSEEKFAVGKKWHDVLNTILVHFYSRLYYANGRYHFEQISERGTSTMTRHCYDRDGVSTATEVVNLDLSMSDLEIEPQTGGKYKSLAALRSAKITKKFPSNNLLETQHWNLNQEGTRQLPRIRTTQQDTRFKFVIPIHTRAEFYIDPSNGPTVTEILVTAEIRIWVNNIRTATTYYLTPVSQDDHANPTWETDEVNGYFVKEIYPPTILNTPIVRGSLYTFAPISDELPGDAGDSFDVYISINFSYLFTFDPSNQFFIDYPEKLNLSIFTKDPSITTVDEDQEPVDAFREKVYEAINSLNNTVVVEFEATFSDEGFLGNGIYVETDTDVWSRSSGEWNRFGNTTGAVKLLQLLAQEIVAMRTVPRRVYQGGYYTTLIGTSNRLNRNSFLYLPLSLSVDTDEDLASGDFVNLERVEVTPAEEWGNPYDAGDQIPQSGPSDPTPPVDPALVLETNEVITGGGGAVTELDIVNTMGATIAAGEVVRITHPTSGAYETVTLTENILPDSVLMEFVSHAFVLSFPDASPITIQVVAHPPGFPGLPFNIDLRGWTDDVSIKFPTYYNFPDPEENSAVIINDRIKIKRDGVLMVYVPGAASATPAQNRVHYWDIDYADRVATFPVPFDEERLTIDAR